MDNQISNEEHKKKHQEWLDSLSPYERWQFDFMFSDISEFDDMQKYWIVTGKNIDSTMKLVRKKLSAPEVKGEVLKIPKFNIL